MLKSATLILTAAISTIFAMGAFASDISVSTENNGPTTVFNVTKNGQPLSNYPITVKGLNATPNFTSNEGTVYLRPDVRSPQNVTLVVTDSNGVKVTKTAFVTVVR